MSCMIDLDTADRTDGQDEFLFIDVQLVRQWLEKNVAQFIGVPGEPCACPMARYLYDFTGHRYRVFATYAMCEFGSINLPNWVIRFVRSLDDEYGFLHIKGSQALELLDRVTATGPQTRIRP